MIIIALGNVSFFFFVILDDMFHFKFGKNRNQDELTAEQRLEVRLLLKEALKKIDDDEILRAQNVVACPEIENVSPPPHETIWVSASTSDEIQETLHYSNFIQLDSEPAILTQGKFYPGKPNQGTPTSSSGKPSEGSPTLTKSSSGKPF